MFIIQEYVQCYNLYKYLAKQCCVVDVENIQILGSVHNSPPDLKVKIIHCFLLKAQIIALSLNLYICMYLSSKCADGRCRKEQQRNPIISYLLDVE